MTTFHKYFNQNPTVTYLQRRDIEKILHLGPASVTEIAEKVYYEKQLVVWNLLGMLRWGKVDVVGEKNHELVFALKEA
jgi:hypothetical protein